MTGRELALLQEHNPKLGKPKKHPAYCVYLGYRLEREQSAGLPPRYSKCNQNKYQYRRCVACN